MGEVVQLSFDPPTRFPASPPAKHKGPTAGQSLFSALMDEFASLGARIPRRSIAIAARQGAECLEEGIEPEVVLVGCLFALRQNKPQYTTSIIADIALHKAGLYQNREDYRRALAQYKQDNDPTLQRILGVLRCDRDADNRLKIGRGTA